MEDNTIINKPSMSKVTLPYGIAFGIIMILEFVVAYALELNAQDNKMVGVLTNLFNLLLLPFLFILLACNNYKKINGGYITFSQSVKTGVAVNVIAGLTFAIFNALFYIIIPESKADILEQSRIAYAKSPGMTAEVLKATMKGIEWFMEPYVAIPATAVIYALVGLVISLIVGAIVKKENPGAF